MVKLDEFVEVAVADGESVGVSLALGVGLSWARDLSGLPIRSPRNIQRNRNLEAFLMGANHRRGAEAGIIAASVYRGKTGNFRRAIRMVSIRSSETPKDSAACRGSTARNRSRLPNVS